MVTLKTDRFLLRPFRAIDIDDYALSRSDAWRQMAMLVGQWHLKGYGMWAVEERDGGRLNALEGARAALGERVEGTAEVQGQSVLVYGIHRDGWRAAPSERERSDP